MCLYFPVPWYMVCTLHYETQVYQWSWIFFFKLNQKEILSVFMKRFDFPKVIRVWDLHVYFNAVFYLGNRYINDWNTFFKWHQKALSVLLSTLEYDNIWRFDSSTHMDTLPMIRKSLNKKAWCPVISLEFPGICIRVSGFITVCRVKLHWIKVVCDGLLRTFMLCLRI